MSSFIEFVYVECKNLASVGNMPLRINLNRHNTTMVVGSNGVGKSSLLLDSICFALFGKPYRSVTKSQLVNTKNNRDLLATVEYKRGQDTIKVIRGYKPAVFEIWVNGKMIDQSSTTRDYQQYFEDYYLGIDYTTFTQIVMIGRANYIPFLSLKASDKRLFVENVLGLEVFTVMSNLHKEDVKAYKASLTELETHRTRLLHTIDKNQALIEQVKRHNTQILNTKQVDNSAKIAQLQADIESIEKQLAQLPPLAVADGGKVSELNKAIKEIDGVVAVKKHECKQHIKNLEFYQSNDTCPVCTQSIDANFKSNIVATAKQELDSIDQALNQYTSLQKELSAKLSELQATIAENDRINRQQALLEQGKVSTLKQIEALSVPPVKIPMQDDSEYVTIVEDTQRQLSEVEGVYNQLLEKGKYYDVITTLLKDNGLKSKIIAEYMPLINKLINTNIKRLGLFASVKIDETFDEEIAMRGFDKMSYNQLSEGEKLRLNMAVMMAWRDVAKFKSDMNCNLLIMDEIFDSSVDAEGTQAFAELLKSVSDLNVFVITHTPEKLADSFRSCIRLEKKDGFTVISTVNNL